MFVVNTPAQEPSIYSNKQQLILLQSSEKCLLTLPHPPSYHGDARDLDSSYHLSDSLLTFIQTKHYLTLWKDTSVVKSPTISGLIPAKRS